VCGIRGAVWNGSSRVPSSVPTSSRTCLSSGNFWSPSSALAAERIDAEQLRRLQAIFEEQRQRAADPLAFLEADLRFHECISEAAGNRLSMEIIKVLSAGLREVRLRSLSKTFNPEKSLAGHRAILEAIRLRDPQGAFAAMRAHLKDVEEAALGRPFQRGGEEG